MIDPPPAPPPAPPELIQPDRGQPAIAIHVLDTSSLARWLAGRAPAQVAVLAAQKFRAEPNTHAILPASDPAEPGWQVALGVADAKALGPWCLARAAEMLPAGTYRLINAEPGEARNPALSLIGWVLGHYRFDRYRGPASDPKRAHDDDAARVLVTSAVKAIPEALAEAAAVCQVRDLVNTPAEDMGPGELEHAIERLARVHHASVRVSRGEALERAFPMVHMVGRAAGRAHAPRMIELEWGAPAHPRIAIIGKGVTFDTGGLDIKPSPAMLLMKKDMGGAAHAIALAQLVMAAKLSVRLHLLVPAAENAIAGNALRPGDVIKSRAGLTVEITNTDAEGRLLLADALARASEEAPALILDFATLTGAARVALGPDLPALFARDDATAEALLAAGRAVGDPLWRLPLHDAYRDYLDSDIADLANAHGNGFAGASVAALFLDRFVPAGVDWVHCDTFAWRPTPKPGRPKGGEALGLRAAWGFLKATYGRTSAQGAEHGAA